MTDLSGVSTADLQAYQSGDMSKVSTEGLIALRGVGSQVTTPQSSGLGSHVDSYLSDKPELQDLLSKLSGRVDAVQNAPDLPNFMVSSARLGVGGAADIGGAALSAIPGAGLVKSAAGYVGGKIAGAVGSVPTSDIGATFGDVGNAFSGMVNREEVAHPLFANVMGYGKDVASLGAEKGIVDLARGGLNMASDAMGNAPQPTVGGKGIPSAADLHAEAQKGYDYADTSGTGVNAQGAQNYFNKAKVEAAQSPTDLLRNGPDEVQKYLDNMDNANGQPISIGDAQQEDIKLREAASKAYRAGDNSLGDRWKTIRDALDQHIYNQQDPTLLTGGPQGFQALKEANRIKSQAYTVEEIENGIKNGLAAEVPQQGVKQFFKGLSKKIDDGKWGQGLSEESKAAIAYAGKTGALTGALKTIGNKLGAEATGGVAGSAAFAAHPALALPGYLAGKAAGIAVGAPFRAGATALQLGKANDVLRTVIDRPTFTPPSLSDVMPTPKPLMLPAPETEYTADAHGNVRALSPEEKVAAQSNRQAASDLGLTQDVSANIYRNNLRAKSRARMGST